MRLPRRVPWSSLAELEQLCVCIYGDENDVNAKVFAINRISAWKTITALPHAIESTLALLVVIVQDQKQSYLSSLSIRQSYATAVIRLVNGLVDPLQVGTYARSIISIAHQLGLPSWLVELRHAATHEDLPSLEVLREAGRQSMTWLLHNYFFPTLNPVSTTQQVTTPIRPLAPILKMYKNTMKIVTRDISLVTQYRPKIVAILRDIERWISESKITANSTAGDYNWSTSLSVDGTPAEGDAKEIWVLERFCDCLMEKGMLVPLSKKKRLYSDDPLLPSQFSIAFWEPLLRHVQGIHFDLPFLLCRRIIYALLDSAASQETVERRNDPTYYMYLACWVSWSMKTWNSSSPAYLDLKKDTLAILMKGLGCNTLPISSQSPTFSLLRHLTSDQEEFEAVTELLLRPSTQIPKTTWNPSDLDVMEARRLQLLSSHPFTSDVSVPTPKTLQAAGANISIPGWRVLEDQKDWRSCPIGVYVN